LLLEARAAISDPADPGLGARPPRGVEEHANTEAALQGKARRPTG